MRRIASRAYMSETGLARWLTKASSAWVRLSMPVSAVVRLGSVAVSSWSTMAASGSAPRPAMSIFSSLATSVMTVKRVASLPVPAVVGTQMMGRAARSAATGTLKSRMRAPSGAAARMAMALAVSIGLPPPKPTSTS